MPPTHALYTVISKVPQFALVSNTKYSRAVADLDRDDLFQQLEALKSLSVGVSWTPALVSLPTQHQS